MKWSPTAFDTLCGEIARSLETRAERQQGVVTFEAVYLWTFAFYRPVIAREAPGPLWECHGRISPAMTDEQLAAHLRDRCRQVPLFDDTDTPLATMQDAPLHPLA